MDYRQRELRDGSRATERKRFEDAELLTLKGEGGREQKMWAGSGS